MVSSNQNSNGGSGSRDASRPPVLRKPALRLVRKDLPTIDHLETEPPAASLESGLRFYPEEGGDMLAEHFTDMCNVVGNLAAIDMRELPYLGVFRKILDLYRDEPLDDASVAIDTWPNAVLLRARFNPLAENARLEQPGPSIDDITPATGFFCYIEMDVMEQCLTVTAVILVEVEANRGFMEIWPSLHDPAEQVLARYKSLRRIAEGDVPEELAEADIKQLTSKMPSALKGLIQESGVPVEEALRAARDIIGDASQWPRWEFGRHVVGSHSTEAAWVPVFLEHLLDTVAEPDRLCAFPYDHPIYAFLMLRGGHHRFAYYGWYAEGDRGFLAAIDWMVDEKTGKGWITFREDPDKGLHLQISAEDWMPAVEKVRARFREIAPDLIG